MARSKIFLGTFLVSMSILMLELDLTRLFSATMYYHFAFLAISLALFGSGASGVFIYVFRRRLPAHRTPLWLGVSSLLFSLGVIVAVSVTLSHPLPVDVSVDLGRLATVYAAVTVPFFFGGCAITFAIRYLARDISRLYLFDLAGAAAGCLLLIPLLNSMGAVNTALLVATTAALAAAVFSASSRDTRAVMALSLALVVALAALTAYNVVTNELDVTVSKGLRERNVVFSRWNSFSRVTVQGGLDSLLMIKIDGDAGSWVAPRADDLARHQGRRRHVSALAYELKPTARVLILGPGGGLDVVTALVYGASSITAVEVNPLIARDVMSTEPFRSYSGDLYQRPGVRLVIDEGRSFIRRSQDRYDLIQATLVDTWAATSAGAFALTENNLYTVEAFVDYVEHLSDDGMLTMTRWYFEPPDQMLRLVSLTRAMTDELGISDAARHVMVVRDARGRAEQSLATYIFKKSPFTDDESRRIETVSQALGYEVIYTPSWRPANLFTRLLEAAEPAEVWSGLESDVAPTWDNSPFFFHSLRWSKLLSGPQGLAEWRKTNLGTFVLFALMALTAALVVVFILGPLLVARRGDLDRGDRRAIAHLLYFASLGAGFIVVEVAMIQKLILFLGHPVYALAVVLSSLLVSSAAGSYLTGRFADQGLTGTLGRVLGALAALIVAYVLVLPVIIYGLVHASLGSRILISVLVLAPLGLAMGMPMPLGIRVLSHTNPAIIPWAWGVNGATSVMGSVAALVIALLAGFDQALLVGAALYSIAIVFVRAPAAPLPARSAPRPPSGRRARRPVPPSRTADLHASDAADRRGDGYGP